MAAQTGRGFWRGFFTGIVLVAAAGLALAWVYPPVPATPPQVAPTSLEAPPAPGQPEGVAEPATPSRQETLLPAPPPGPLIAADPGAGCGAAGAGRAVARAAADHAVAAEGARPPGRARSARRRGKRPNTFGPLNACNTA